MTASNITLNSASEGWANLNPGAADLIYGWIPKHNMSKKIHSHAFSGHALIIVFLKETKEKEEHNFNMTLTMSFFLLGRSNVYLALVVMMTSLKAVTRLSFACCCLCVCLCPFTVNFDRE